MHTTNYRDTLITVSADCPVTRGMPPAKPDGIAGRQFALLSAAPGAMTSDDLLLKVECDRKGPVTAEDFFGRPQACLRASPLVKKHGFGLYHDGQSRVTLVPMEGAEYARLLADPSVTKTPGMRSSRG